MRIRRNICQTQSPSEISREINSVIRCKVRGSLSTPVSHSTNPRRAGPQTANGNTGRRWQPPRNPPVKDPAAPSKASALQTSAGRRQVNGVKIVCGSIFRFSLAQQCGVVDIQMISHVTLHDLWIHVKRSYCPKSVFMFNVNLNTQTPEILNKFQCFSLLFPLLCVCV